MASRASKSKPSIALVRPHSGVLCPGLGSFLQKGHRAVGAGLEEDREIIREAEGVVHVFLGEDNGVKALTVNFWLLKGK